MDVYKKISEYFFSDWIMIVLALIAFIVGIRNYNKETRIITYYLGAFTLVNFSCIYFELINPNRLIDGLVVNAFIIAEFTFFYFYLSSIIYSIGMKLIMKVIMILFWGFYLFIWYKWPRYFYYSNYLSCALVSFCVIIPCLFYFYELFTASKPIDLKSHAPFWIVVGILFHNGCSLPIFLLADYININHPSYFKIFFPIVYTAYSLLCLLFIKAYLCKKPITS